MRQTAYPHAAGVARSLTPARVGGVPPCDIIVGPGNNWVTAAKSLVSGRYYLTLVVIDIKSLPKYRPVRFVAPRTQHVAMAAAMLCGARFIRAYHRLDFYIFTRRVA